LQFQFTIRGVLLTSRWVFGLIFLVCAALLGVAFYMEHVMGLEPCPLCWLQRFGFMGAGLGVAGRQLWLQSLPADQVPACGPSVDYMLDVLPWFEVLSTALQGTGDCAEVVWRFLGLSIPGWTAVFFSLLVITGLVLMFRRQKPREWIRS
jgi:disulfide bond formation protein DsbB